jgi:D-mannonate dehydratase
MYIINNDKQQQKQLNEQTNKLNEYSNNLSSLVSQTNNMVPVINNLGVRVNELDKQTTNVIEMITVPTKNSFQVRKYNFTPTSYAAELEFFKTLSPSDQIDYLNMPKEAKRLKYSTPKSN